MEEIYEFIKKKLHLTDRQMTKKFPDVCLALMEEEDENLKQEVIRRLKLMGLKKE